MSKQQPQASAAAHLGTAEERTDSDRHEGCKDLLYGTDPSYNSNNAVSYVQHTTVNNTDGLKVSNEKSTHTTSPYETCTTSKPFNRPPVNVTDSCNMQVADAQDQLPVQEVCYLIIICYAII